MSTTPRFAAGLAAIALIVVAGPSGVSGASDGSSHRQLAGVRQATAGFHRLDRAVDAGYEPFLDCFDLPDVGGMGQHYVHFGLLDGEVDAGAPEALVYEVRRDRLRLVAVEYVVPDGFVDPDVPPVLFGQRLHRNADLGVWVLHAWIWRDNPLGMFQDFNPNVRDCP